MRASFARVAEACAGPLRRRRCRLAAHRGARQGDGCARNTPSISTMTDSSKASSCARAAAHARITELDLAPALAMPGVAAAISLLGDDHDRPLCRRADRGRGREGPQAPRLRRSPRSGSPAKRLPSVIGLDAARKRGCAGRVRKAQTERTPATSPKACGSPASWKGNVRGPSAAFSQQGEEGAQGLAHRGARRARSAAGRGDIPRPRRSRMRASSRMPPSRGSTAIA